MVVSMGRAITTGSIMINIIMIIIVIRPWNGTQYGCGERYDGRGGCDGPWYYRYYQYWELRS